MAKGIQIDGEKFARFREESFLSQESFATKVGVKRSTIQRISKPGIHGIHAENFRQIAEGTGLTIEQLREKVGADSPIIVEDGVGIMQKGNGDVLILIQAKRIEPFETLRSLGAETPQGQAYSFELLRTCVAQYLEKVRLMVEKNEGLFRRLTTGTDLASRPRAAASSSDAAAAADERRKRKRKGDDT